MKNKYLDDHRVGKHAEVINGRLIGNSYPHTHIPSEGIVNNQRTSLYFELKGKEVPENAIPHELALKRYKNGKS